MPIENPELFKGREETSSGYLDTFERSGTTLWFEKRKDNTIANVTVFDEIQDRLLDTDGDGIPDKRIQFAGYRNRKVIYEDSNLDGHFDNIIDQKDAVGSDFSVKKINEQLMSDDE